LRPCKIEVVQARKSLIKRRRRCLGRTIFTNACQTEQANKQGACNYPHHPSIQSFKHAFAFPVRVWLFYDLAPVNAYNSDRFRLLLFDAVHHEINNPAM
jgi:hypothetical protein